MSSVPVIKFLFKSEWKILSEALNLNPIYESLEVGSANDLSTYLSGSSGGLIITSLRDKNDLIQLATFIKQIKRNQNPPYVKVFVINFSGDKQFERAVAKLGILDIIEDKIQTKALKFKIDFMMKSVSAQVKKHAQVQANAAVKTLDSAKSQDKKISDHAPVWENALDCEDDIWLLKYEQDCKKVLTRWLVKLMGPSPYVAQWIDSGTAGVWKFEFKGENEFIYGKGHWYYRGDQKPDFIWSENVWSFTGSSFDLFYKDGELSLSRLKLKDKVLSIAKNSDYAKTKDKIIIESFDKDLVFKKEGMSGADSELVDKDQKTLSNLEGKGKTDHLQQGPLSGKGKTSQLSTAPLSMELNQGENNLSSHSLAQKGQTSKSSSFWKGKNEYASDDTNDPLSTEADQSSAQGAELGMKNKGKHEKFYKNHNEAEKFEAKDIGHSIKKDAVSDNLKGKSATDEIEGYLTSPDAKNEKTDKTKSPEEQSGKSSTDKLAGHLSSPEKRQEKAEAEANERAAKKTAETKNDKALADEELSGQSSTDKLAGHLRSPENRKEKETNDSKNTADSLKYRDQDKEKFDQAATQKDLQELKDALNSFKKAAPASASQGPQAETEDSAEITSKVLPFSATRAAKESGEAEDVLKGELAEAIMTAKVTSFLIQEGVKVHCELDDHFDQTIIFITNQPDLDSGRTVLLNLNFNYMNKNTSLKFDGNITQIDSDGEGSHYVTVEISQDSVSAFNSFMKLYTTRQHNINLFLKTAKGL